MRKPRPIPPALSDLPVIFAAAAAVLAIGVLINQALP
jgi:hypothetical protein